MRRVSIFLFLILSACTVGPDYKKPEMDLPEKWENQSEAQQKSNDINEEIKWWEKYNDATLNYLIREAINSNYDLKIAFARICEAQALLLGAEAALAPEVDANGSFSNSLRSVNTQALTSQKTVKLKPKVPLPPPVPPTTATVTTVHRHANLYQLGFTTSWEIDLFGRLRRGIEAAGASFEAQVEDMHDVVLSLIAEVASNYMSLRGAQQQLEITKTSVVSWDSIYKLNLDLLKAGIATDIDVLNAKGSLEQTRAVLPSLEATIKSLMHQLAILLGLSPTKLYDQLSKTESIPHIPLEIFAGLPSELLRKRPDIRSAERILAASNAEIGIAVGGLFPVFSLTGSVGYQSKRTSNLLTPKSGAYSFGPGFSWSIADFGRVRSQINASEAVRDENLYHYKSTILKALADVETSLVNFSAEAKRIEDLKTALESNKLAAELSMARFESGRVNYINVRQAQLTYQINELSVAGSQTDLALNSVALYKALGGGWQEQMLEFRD